MSRDVSNLLGKIDAALAETRGYDTVPEGWWSAKEYAKAKNVSYTRAAKICAELVEAGKLERRDFRPGPGKAVRYYRLR